MTAVADTRKEPAFARVLGVERGSSRRDSDGLGYGPHADDALQFLGLVAAIPHTAIFASSSVLLAPRAMIEQAGADLDAGGRLNAVEAVLLAARGAAAHANLGSLESLSVPFDDARGEPLLPAVIRYAAMAVVGYDLLGSETAGCLYAPFREGLDVGEPAGWQGD